VCVSVCWCARCWKIYCSLKKSKEKLKPHQSPHLLTIESPIILAYLSRQIHKELPASGEQNIIYKSQFLYNQAIKSHKNVERGEGGKAFFGRLCECRNINGSPRSCLLCVGVCESEPSRAWGLFHKEVKTLLSPCVCMCVCVIVCCVCVQSFFMLSGCLLFRLVKSRRKLNSQTFGCHEFDPVLKATPPL